MLGLYCCWGAKIVDGGFYVSSVNAKYILAFYSEYGKLLLVSNTQSDNVESHDVFIDSRICEIYELPSFSNYISSARYFFKIQKGLRYLSQKANKIYVKTPDPFCWLLSLFKKDKQLINYHFVSNPLDVIIHDNNRGLCSRVMRYVLYYPEFIITCIAAYFNNVSANGPSVSSKVPHFLRRKIRVLIESTVTDDEISLKNVDYCRLLETKKILCVSRLVPGKGLELLFEAFKYLSAKYPDKIEQLVVVGDGPLKDSLGKWILKNKMENKIKMLGFVRNGPELERVYSCCDIFVNPSLSETGPRVLIEAMIEGCFCISTDVGYASYTMSQDTQSFGLITKSNTVSGIVNSIEWAINNSEKLSMVAYGGKKRAFQFTLNKFVSEVVNDSLLKG